MRKESAEIPDGRDPPTADELEKLSALRDIEADAKRAYDQAVVDSSEITKESWATLGQIQLIQQTLEQQSTATAATEAAVSDWQGRVADVRAALDEVTAQLLGGVGTEVPLLLLPVRLETRFEYGDEGDKPQALRIRIYPDDIHVDSHETGLSIDEEVWGRNFVAMNERAASDAERLSAWRVLSSRFGARRAAWIAATKLKQ